MPKDAKPDLFLYRRGKALYPLDDLAEAQLELLPQGRPLRTKRPTTARSVPQHRLYWALLTKIVDNLSQDVSEDALHVWIKEELGITEPIQMRDGSVRRVASSIAFDKMDQAEFQLFFDRVKALIEDRLFPRMGAAFEREARAMLAPPKEAA
jgi:hypothetical protein